MSDQPNHFEDQLNDLLNQASQAADAPRPKSLAANSPAPAEPAAEETEDNQPEQDRDDALLAQIDQLLAEQTEQALDGDFQSIDELLADKPDKPDEPEESEAETVMETESATQAEDETESDEAELPEGGFETVDQIMAAATDEPVETDEAEPQPEDPAPVVAEETAPPREEEEDDHQIHSIEEVLNLTQAVADESDDDEEPVEVGSAAAVADELNRDEAQAGEPAESSASPDEPQATPPPAAAADEEAEPAPAKTKSFVLPTIAINECLVDLLEAANKPFDKLPMGDVARQTVGYIAMGNCFMAACFILYAMFFR